MDRSRPRGPENAEVVVVGDVPSIEEMENGLAFSGKLGHFVDDILYYSGFDPKNVLFVNCFPYRKLGRATYSAYELGKSADEILIPLINSHPRKVILVLGNNAVCATGINSKPEGVNSYRGRLIHCETTEYPLVASLAPYFILQKPDEVDDFYADFKYAHRIAKGDFEAQAPIVIRDIEKVSDIDDLLVEFKQEKAGAYDFETTSLDPDTCLVVTASFSTAKIINGNYLAWFWGGYDRLQARYEENVLKQFVEGFDSFFQQAGKEFKLMGWNSIAFDDWVAERWVGHELPGSQLDGMIVKWSVNNEGRHGLKLATARYLGYPDYEAELSKHIKGITARRGRVLEKEDLDLLERFGHEPSLTKGGRPAWPKTLDKKWCAYALVDYETLKLYACYDALYTKLTIDQLFPRVLKENLGKSCKLRHDIAHDLMRMEQEGLPLDVELNRRLSVELGDVHDKCMVGIQREVDAIDPSMKDFNPSTSSPQLGKLLYGAPTKIPTVDRQPLYDGYKTWRLDKTIDKFEENFYSAATKKSISKAIKDKSFDFDHCKTLYSEEFLKEFPEYVNIVNEKKDLFIGKDYYCEGLYEPIAFTKKSKAPACGGPILLKLYEKEEKDLLKLVLMERKASKLKSTFVDAVYNKRDKYNVVHPKYRSTGTKSARISSAEPNGQNWQEYIRGQIFSGLDHQFSNFDLQQAEIYCLAARSQDKNLLAALVGSDIHRMTGAQIFKKEPKDVSKQERYFAKTLNFAIIYGLGVPAIALLLGISEREAQALRDQYEDTYPGMFKFIADQIALGSTPPYYVYTSWGTRRSTKGLLSIDREVVGHTQRVCGNTSIQGDAGELTLYKITEMNKEIRKLEWDAKFVNTTHDSGTAKTDNSLAWNEERIVEDEKVLVPVGPYIDMMDEVISRPAPVYPLSTITFKADYKVSRNWYGEVNLKLALDPRNEIFNWALIKDEMTDEEREEMDIVLA